MPDPLLVIACGALAREIRDLKRQHGWQHLHLQCMDARLHNEPARIPDLLREKIRINKGRYEKIYVAYADCGTAGGIDRVLEEENIERLPGAHCYQFFAGTERFMELMDAEPGTFFLTDFLARNFERLVVRPLRIDERPALRDAFFGNYRRVVYLSQTVNEKLLQAAEAAASRLGLEFEHVHCGYGGLEAGLRKQSLSRFDAENYSHLLA